jgi:hypothetical protein
MNLRHAAALALVGCCVWPTFGLALERGLQSTYTRDNSDWWSLARLEPLGNEAAKGKEAEEPNVSPPAPTNFVIAGVNLWRGIPISEAKDRIANAPIIERGDAASSRAQICFQSAEDSGSYKLIFEEGEVARDAYLIEDGAPWKGMDNCVPSEQVSTSAATESGLHLGISVAEVKAILGKPSSETKQRIVYASLWQHPLTAEELRAFRKSGGPADETRSDRATYIEIRFLSGKAKYIALSATETY